MKAGFDSSPWAPGLIAACALALLGACGNAGQHQPQAAGAAPGKAVAQSAAGPAAAASGPDCLPGYRAVAPHTVGAPIVRTARGGTSPPAASLPPAKTGPAAGTHVVPLHRMRPHSECPPPSTAPVPHSG